MKICHTIFLSFALGLLPGCSQIDLLNATIPSSGYQIVKDIPYAAHDRGTLDIYVPDHPAPGHPVVVFYYGGSWQNGNKDDYLFAGEALASQGIIAVIPDYRLYPQIYFPTFIQDVAQSFVWAHFHIATYGGNPHNLFAAGHSAGAYNAIMLALNRCYIMAAGGSPEWIRGAIGIAGPYDFLPLTDPQLIELFSKVPPAETQPITFARRHSPPLLLETGDADDQVGPFNSYHLAEKEKFYGNEVTVKTYAGLGHIGIALSLANGFRGRAPALQDLSDFVQSHSAAEIK